MGANYSDYTSIINSVADRYDDTSAGTLATIRREITSTLRRIWSSTPNWKFARSSATIATVASTASYTLDSTYGFGRLYDVVNTTSSVRMVYYSDREIDGSNPASTTTGSPYAYRLWGASSGIQTMQPYPIPDGVYTITYKFYRLPTIVDLETTSTQLVNDALEPDLPAEFRELLVLYPLVELYKRDSNPLANVSQIQYENLLAQMRSRYEDEPDILHVLRSEDENTNLTGPNLMMPADFGPTVH